MNTYGTTTYDTLEGMIDGVYRFLTNPTQKQLIIFGKSFWGHTDGVNTAIERLKAIEPEILTTYNLSSKNDDDEFYELIKVYNGTQDVKRIIKFHEVHRLRGNHAAYDLIPSTHVMRFYPKYDTLEAKTDIVYSFLAQKEIKTLIIIGEGGSGKSVATTAAIEKYKKVDPDIYNIVAIGYEGESRGPCDEVKGALTCPKEEQKNIYHMLQEDEDILAYEASKPTEVVYFLRGGENA